MVKCSNGINLPDEEENKTEDKPCKIKDHEFGTRHDVISNIPYGFRLQDEAGSTGDKLERETTTSTSIYSAYKQRIDSMFDETRSQMSYYGGVEDNVRMKYYGRLGFNYGSYSDDTQNECRRGINNAVQARIEKMFADMAKSGALNKEKNIIKIKSPHQPLPTLITGNSFNVDYLGSVPLTQKVTSLQGLQEPLKNLYFSYCKAIETHVGRCWTGGTLEISSNGLKVHHRGRDSGELEQLNPFPTIAVWAAVKFVCRKKSRKNTEREKRMEYAFLPLIADPEAVDKGTLFRPLNETEENLIMSISSQKCTKKTTFNHHSPMFAVVMRKIGVSRQLECHGFVCVCSEDAIVIAANLYQALMTNMKKKNQNYSKCDKYFEQSTRNGISCISLEDECMSNGINKDGHSILEIRNDKNIIKESYTCKEELKKNAADKSHVYSQKANVDITNKQSTESDNNATTVAKIPPPIPVRPPRRNKRTSSSGSEDGEDLSFNMSQRDSKEWSCVSLSPEVTSNQVKCNENDIYPFKNKIKSSENDVVPVRHAVSERQSLNSIQIATDFTEGGDILTKVAIPRSRSFLNASGPFTRYKRSQKSGELYSNGSGGTGSSPLGFNELFTEFKMQEGLNSMDDILDVIIDAEGMSFNDLKPIYKEFLLKLAVTLTKDELYQRSKSIMRRQKKKLGGHITCKRKKTFPTSGSGLKRVFRRSVSKLRPSKPRLTNFEFTSVLFPSESVHVGRKLKKIPSIESSTTSTSSYSVRTPRMKRQLSTKSSGFVEGIRLPRRLSNYRRSQKRENMLNMIKQSQASTSEDSDFFSMVKCGRTATSVKKADMNNGEGPNRSSSGYFSCSECSYDSESCTCTSADKCYCSQGETKRKTWLQGNENDAQKDISLSSCGCDTDSCIDSDKCYCSVPYHHHHKNHKKVCPLEHSNGNEIYSKHKDNSANDEKNENSVFEQLRQRGFAASESSLSRADSPNTAWQKNERSLATSDRKLYSGSIKSTKSLEFLQVNPTTRHNAIWELKKNDQKGSRCTNRMDVYEPLPMPYKNSLQRKLLGNNGKSYSSENIPLDYEALTSSRSEDEETSGSLSEKHQRKVLVVSARDPRGRIIYMGASCRSDQGRSACRNSISSPVSKITDKNSTRYKGKPEKSSAGNASEALSVKKSAEIAALFSDFKFTQVRDTISRRRDLSNKGAGTDLFYSAHEPSNKYISKYRNQQLGNNLENSLGYLP